VQKRAVLWILPVLLGATSIATAADWLQWRGPSNTGMAVGDAPLRWSDSANIKWKTAIPGKGHSTPLIVRNRLYLTTAVPTGRSSDVGPNRSRAGGGADAGLEHRFEVMAFDRDTGKIAWQRTATVATPHEGYHRTYGSFASNSPATDGKRLFAGSSNQSATSR
jgi:outer membrane protein assembly factor BamB